MISCISAENVHEFGQAFHSQFRLRHEGFVERQQYDVSVYDGMEFDRYDTPASRYLVYHTDDGHALGVSRLTPTTLSCMLKDLWPHLVNEKSQMQSPTVWEGTRYCVHKDAPPGLRQRIVHEMACAYLEFGLSLGLEKIIGLMPTYIYRSVFERPGIEMEYLGPVEAIGRHKCRAVAIPVTAQQLANVRRKMGITNRVLRFTSQEGEIEHVKPPGPEDLGLSAGKTHAYDFAKASQVLKAMDFLRIEAKATRIEEIVTMIDASFNLMLTTYYCILRYEMTRLAGTEM